MFDNDSVYDDGVLDAIEVCPSLPECDGESDDDSAYGPPDFDFDAEFGECDEAD